MSRVFVKVVGPLGRILVVASTILLSSSVASPGVVMCASPFSARDVELMALVAGSEARGSLEGPEYVIQVIINRVRDPRWANTVEGVIRQPHQFALTFANDSIIRLMSQENRLEREAWQRVYELAYHYACVGPDDNFSDVYHFVNPTKLGLRMDASRRVVGSARGPSWPVGMYVHPISDGLKHWFLVDKGAWR